MSRWEIKLWWRPREWSWGYNGRCSRNLRDFWRSWQFGPLEIRKWEASS